MIKVVHRGYCLIGRGQYGIAQSYMYLPKFVQQFCPTKINNMEVKEVYWDELCGNRYRYGLHPTMLSEDGYLYTTCTYVQGCGYQAGKVPVRIKFDESYVLSFLVQFIFEKLQPNAYNDAQKLFAKAYRQWQEKQKR